ncbi:MAG: PIG-L family deacetylase, partial [Faecousia sp.]
MKLTALRRTLAALLCAVCLCPLLPRVNAAEASQDISSSTEIRGSGYDSFGFLVDKNIKSYYTSGADAVITLENSAGMGSLYLLFDLEFGSYTVTDEATGASITAGAQGMLHEYIDLTAAFSYAPTCVTLRFSGGTVRLSEIYIFSDGEVPDFVQRWNAPLEGGADILLLSTHGDDDQLFFAGLLPLYAGERNCRVQVVYMTDHRNLTNARTHEMLNGLWAVGVDVYPVFGAFADFRIDSLQGTYDKYASMGVSQDTLLSFVTSQLRRFKPQVVVGHDIAGEYGHGMHMVYTDTLLKALEISADAAVFPESADVYGTWDVPKTYLHLYGENQIVLDYDTPLEAFGGLTAFQVTQKYGFPCHESQQWTWFRDWINGHGNEITTAAQISSYNPCYFGLYRSTVGEDVLKNDFLEHIVTYAEQERLEQERLEQERLEQER